MEIQDAVDYIDASPEVKSAIQTLEAHGFELVFSATSKGLKLLPNGNFRFMRTRRRSPMALFLQRLPAVSNQTEEPELSDPDPVNLDSAESAWIEPDLTTSVAFAMETDPEEDLEPDVSKPGKKTKRASRK